MDEEQRLRAYLERHNAMFAWQAWEDVRAILPMPNAGIGPDGDVLLYTWDKNEHHYEIEVFANGDIEYFYFNRQTSESSECSPDQIRGLFTD